MPAPQSKTVSLSRLESLTNSSINLRENLISIGERLEYPPKTPLYVASDFLIKDEVRSNIGWHFHTMKPLRFMNPVIFAKKMSGHSAKTMGQSISMVINSFYPFPFPFLYPFELVN